MTDQVEIIDRKRRTILRTYLVGAVIFFTSLPSVVRQPPDIPALVDEVLSTLPLAENVAVKVENAMTDPVAEVDANQIVQVMVNLITNAQQAMPEGGMLRIGMSSEDESIVIVVTDTGCGIPTENVAKLFDPFFTTKQVGKGTGLDLAVTHGIVKMHHGSIDVESKADPAKGPTETTFIIKLPRHEL